MPFNERSLANLKPFPKGNNANPGGRPKDVSLLAEVYRILREPVTEGSKQQKKHAVASTLVSLAMNGDMNAIKLIVAYTDGQPTQSVQIDADVQVTVTAIRKALELVA